MRVVVPFRILWPGTLCKWTLDCDPIFSYASKLSFCIIYVPLPTCCLCQGKRYIRVSDPNTMAYVYVIARGLQQRPYALKRLKVMPKSYKGNKFILCIIDEVTNYLITGPKYQSRLKKIGNALIESVISKYCIPEYIIMNQDSAFIS